MIHERVKRDSVWLQMTKPNDEKLRTCTYSKLSGFGHTIYGKQHQKKFQGILQILGINLGAKKCNKSIKEAFLVAQAGHSVEISGFLCHIYFTYNQFQGIVCISFLKNCNFCHFSGSEFC